MSLDFIPWLKKVPFIDKVWKGVAGQVRDSVTLFGRSRKADLWHHWNLNLDVSQVLGEDLPLVMGQQDRLVRGGDTWSFPVSYDKIAVRYRRWRNGVASGREGTGFESRPVSMSAGEMFSVDEGSADGDEESEASECVVEPGDWM